MHGSSYCGALVSKGEATNLNLEEIRNEIVLNIKINHARKGKGKRKRKQHAAKK